MDNLERLMRKVKVSETGCWVWTGATIGNGYGQVRREQRAWLVHRWSYTALVGPIPPGLDLDHLCRVRLCCNPAHLEPVTRKENLLRGVRTTRATCSRGHARDERNEYRNRVGERRCRACDSENGRSYKERKRARAIVPGSASGSDQA